MEVQTTSRSTASTWGWGILIVLCVLLVLSGVGLYSSSDSPSVFESDTGVMMSEAQQNYPTVVEQVVRNSQNMAIALVGIGLMGLTAAWAGFRDGSRWGWNTLWVLVVLLFVVGLKPILTGGRTDIGGIYVGLAAIALLGQVLARGGLEA